MAMPQRSARSARPERSQRDPQVAPSADAAAHNDDLIGEVLVGLGSRRAGVKFGASKALRILSERVPEALYPHFSNQPISCLCPIAELASCRCSKPVRSSR